MHWLAFALYLPVVAALSYRAVLLWPKPAGWACAVVLAAVAWRAWRIGKKQQEAAVADVIVAGLACAALAWRQLTISPP